MALKEAFVLLALLAVGAAADNSRSLLTVDTSCRAFGFLSIEQIGEGSCRGTVKANCTSLDQSRPEKTNIFKTWFEDGLCDDDVQQSVAEKLADSVGGIWAGAIAHVSCTNEECEVQGHGCGWAMADTSGWGASFAQMFVDAAEEAVKEEDSPELDEFCAQDMIQAGESLGDDADSARAVACASGEDTEEYQQEYTKISSENIVEAMKIAASAICASQSKKSLCNPERKIPKMKKCNSATISRCCNTRTIHRRVCVCSRCNNPLRLDSSSAPKVVWEDSTGKKCSCPASTIEAQ